ncbi:MAG TPA: hypothetical protein VHA78_00620 [Candidatus Peribacteraceae bacterium]|nr:hypothetical protein [Candidatus Peribacteraceae bacterium]
MLQRVREWLTLVLIALLPFHALAVTVLTKIIAGPGHAPLSVLAGWKEALLGIILLIAIIEWAKKRSWNISIDWLDVLILILVILTATISDVLHTGRSLALLGFKYDLLPLAAFFVARRVGWSAWFLEVLMTVILWVGGIVAVYGIVSFFLPPQFFYALGYSDATSLYIPNGPLAAFQQIGGLNVNRIQGPMSGPNQLGIWLLIPISIALLRVQKKAGAKLWALLIILLIALLMTFCRAAWVATFVMLLIIVYPWLRNHSSRRMWYGGAFTLLVLVFAAAALFPGELVRVSSTRGHLEHPLQAVQMMIAHPFGQGLGSAGPASNHVSDACVLLRPQDDPSWAKSQPNLCVFLGDTQVQPMNRVCQCPFLPENWYLQIGVELGWIGFVVYLALIVLVLVRLTRIHEVHGEGMAFFLMFLGISVAALFLHAWEDAAVAYGAWMMLAAVLRHDRRSAPMED